MGVLTDHCPIIEHPGAILIYTVTVQRLVKPSTTFPMLNMLKPKFTNAGFGGYLGAREHSNLLKLQVFQMKAKAQFQA